MSCSQRYQLLVNTSLKYSVVSAVEQANKDGSAYKKTLDGISHSIVTNVSSVIGTVFRLRISLGYQLECIQWMIRKAYVCVVLLTLIFTGCNGHVYEHCVFFSSVAGVHDLSISIKCHKANRPSAVPSLLSLSFLLV